MSEHTFCQLCMERHDEWDEPGFEEHLRARHKRESVEQMYPEDLAARVFDVDDGGVDAAGDRSTGDSGGTGTETGPGRSETGPGAGTGTGGSVRGTGSRGGETEPRTGPAGGTGTDEELRGKKWFVIGVGGAGNHLLDSLLLRRDTLARRDDPLSVVWEGGLAGYLSLNTNDAEISETYYAKRDLGLSIDELRTQLVIANRVYGGKGAGRQWTVGRDTMQWEFEDDRNPITDGKWPVREPDIRGAQAVMFVHSVTKGTGCGATPVLARELGEMLNDDELLYDKPMLSAVVLPKQTGSRTGEMIRGVVGTSLLSQWVKGIIPFDNGRLAEHAIGPGTDLPDIDDHDWVPQQYRERNRVFVKFIESFMLSSVPTTADTSNPVSGDVFDVRDSFGPVLDKYSVDPDREYQPAVVMAPVVGRSQQTAFDEDALELLASSALKQGRLVDCDPATAWGGTFLVFGPEEAMADVRPLLDDGVLRETLAGEEYLASDRAPGSAAVDVYTDQLVVPHADSVNLWGLLWNPEIPPLQRMYEYAQQRKDDGTSQGAEALRDVWHLVEPLFGSLGRENMG